MITNLTHITPAALEQLRSEMLKLNMLRANVKRTNDPITRMFEPPTHVYTHAELQTATDALYERVKLWFHVQYVAGFGYALVPNTESEMKTV